METLTTCEGLEGGGVLVKKERGTYLYFVCLFSRTADGAYPSTDTLSLEDTNKDEPG
jgi:hypothetical protein